MCEEHCQKEINICVFDSEESNYSTKVDLFAICDCGERSLLSDYYGYSIYSNILNMIDYLDYDYDDFTNEQEYAEFDFQLYKYLQSLKDLFGYPIHAIGVKAHEMLGKRYEDRYVKVLWKDRFISNFTPDRFEDLDFM